MTLKLPMHGVDGTFHQVGKSTKMRPHNQFTANNQVFVNIALLALAIVCYIIADTKVPKLIRETPV